jgi:hypothetical protein
VFTGLVGLPDSPGAALRLYMLCDGLQMAGARLHLKGGGGASKQRGCGLRCPHTKMQREAGGRAVARYEAGECDRHF